MINLQVTYTEDDYIPAMRKYLMHKPKFIALFTLVYLVLISLFRLLFGSGADFGTAWFALGSIACLLGLIGVLLYVLPHQRFRHSYKALDEYWFEVNEQGITYETEYEDGALPWRRCTELLEGKRFYIFEHDHRRITVIPKRAFKNKEEENSFREILKRKLKPALSAKLLKQKDATPGEDYVPPEKAPDWR